MAPTDSEPRSTQASISEPASATPPGRLPESLGAASGTLTTVPTSRQCSDGRRRPLQARVLRIGVGAKRMALVQSSSAQTLIRLQETSRLVDRCHEYGAITQNSRSSGSASTTTSLRPPSIRSRLKRGDRLCLLIAVCSEVEAQSVLAGLRHPWRTAPGDLGATMRRTNGGLLVLVPDQRPAAVLCSRSSQLPASRRRRPHRRIRTRQRKLLPASITQNSLPSGSASTTWPSSGR